MKQSHLIAVAALATLGLLLLLNNPGLRDEAHSRLPRRMHHSSGPQHIKHKKEGQHNEAFDHAGFDPEVAHHSGEYEEEYPDAMEENWREDDEWWDEHYDEQHGGFNISHRLEVVFPLIDIDHDGKVSAAEMEKWHLAVGLNASMQRASHEFASTDADGNGKVSLEEYLGDDHSLVAVLEQARGNMTLAQQLAGADHYSLPWVKTTLRTFQLADADGSNDLDGEEFFQFLHPEESTNAKLIAHLLTEALAERDLDDDQRLSLVEFEQGLWNELKPWDTTRSYHYDYEQHMDEEDPEKAATEHAAMQQRFVALDANGDGQVDAEELRAELPTLHPSEAVFARRQAGHLIEQADADADKHLTLAEMLANPYVFYSAAMTDQDEYDHDEFK